MTGCACSTGTTRSGSWPRARGRVTGVTVRSRADGTNTDLDADLVVDASGRNSHASEWLVALGYPLPRESVVNAFLGYSSRVYAPPDGIETDWKAIVLTSRPPDSKRAGVLFPLNGGLWHVTLVGSGHDYPPTDESGLHRVRQDAPLADPARRARRCQARDVDQRLPADREPASSFRTDGVISRGIRSARRCHVRVQPCLCARDERCRAVGPRASGMAAERRDVRHVPETTRQGRGHALAAGDERGLPLSDDGRWATQRDDEVDAPLCQPRRRGRDGRQRRARHVHRRRAPRSAAVRPVPPGDRGASPSRPASRSGKRATTAPIDAPVNAADGRSDGRARRLR